MQRGCEVRIRGIGVKLGEFGDGWTESLEMANAISGLVKTER